MSEINQDSPTATVVKTKEGDKPVTRVEFGSLGNFKVQGWETPHPDFLKGGRLGLQVNAGILSWKEGQQQASKLDEERQKLIPKIGPYPPRQRNFAQEALAFVAGPNPQS